jgi:hypothetical protein
MRVMLGNRKAKTHLLNRVDRYSTNFPISYIYGSILF